MKSHLLLILLTLSALTSYGQQIDVVLPDHYEGWVFLVPIRDTVAFACPLVGGKYAATAQGLAYIPDALTHRTFRVRLYQQDRNVEPETKYSGLVEDHLDQNHVVHRYLQFYLPTGKERKLPAGAEYWRQANRRASLSQQGKDRFKALLAAEQLFFK
jgi:hypothetical protein